MRSSNYKFSVNEIINHNLTVLEQIRMKNGNSTCRGYHLKCNKDGYEWNSTEYNLIKGKGCPVCSNPPRIILKGYNDIATTHPHLVKYFVNIEDVYTHSYSSTDIVKIKCPYCKQIINKRIELLRYGYICPQCNDGISMPNKVMFGLLNYLQENNHINNIVSEYNETWSKNRRYDFYFEYNKNKYIVEMNGKQHYLKDGGFYKIGGRTLEEEQENDRLKKELATANGIKEENYIIIDCRKSDFEFIENNILNSKLGQVFDLSTVDWKYINEKSQKNNVKIACDYFNCGYKIEDIVLKINVSNNTIRDYLKRGAKLGWCNYDPLDTSNKGSSKPVKCIELNKIFNSIVEASNYTNINVGCIGGNCSNKLKSAGGLHWEYV